MDKPASEPSRFTHQLPGVATQLRIASMLLDSGGRIMQWSKGSEELTGYRATEVIGRDIGVLSGSDLVLDSDEIADLLTNSPSGYGQVRRADGTIRAVEWRSHPLTMPDGSTAILAIGLDAVDINRASTQMALMDAFFHQAPFGFVILDTQLRYVMLNEALARINRRPIADHYGRHVRDVMDSTDIDAYEQMLQDVLKTGETVLDLRIDGRATTAPGEDRRWAVSWYRIADAQGVGIALCGIIFDLTEAQRATLDATRSRARLDLLSQASARLGISLDLHDTAQALTDLVVEEFADLAAVDLVEEVIAGDRLPQVIGPQAPIRRIAAASRLDPTASQQLLEVEQPRPAGSTNALWKTLGADHPQLIVRRSSESISEFPPTTGNGAAITPTSLILAPLQAHDRRLGAITFIRAGDREPFTDDDLPLAAELANRAALSLDNARLYRQEQQAAYMLQRSLLPQRLPVLAELEAGFSYRPGSDTAEAGGDWCDVIALPGRRVALVIGDVMGHGIPAAAAMGRYRTAVQSLMAVGLDPGLLLTRLNELAITFDDEALATCLVAVYDPVKGRCVLASAGHPPPLLSVAPNAAMQVVSVNQGAPLGVKGGNRYTTTVINTPAEAQLLFYTDGVVEAKKSAMDDGIASFARRARSILSKGGSPAEICEILLRSTPAETSDDAAILLARFHGLQPS